MSKLTSEIETGSRQIWSPNANRSCVVADRHDKPGIVSREMRLNRIETDGR